VQEGLPSEVILQAFFAHRIQPLQAHAQVMWLYARLIDPTRGSAKELTKSVVSARIYVVLGMGLEAEPTPCPTPFSRGVPSPQCHIPITREQNCVKHSYPCPGSLFTHTMTHHRKMVAIS
jgi:hypothetical protein